MSSFAQILNEFRVQAIPTAAARGPFQTHAGKTLENIYEDHGEAHLRDVLTCLTEAENNAMALVAPVITAVSDVLRAHAGWWERDASAWLEVMDRTDLVQLHWFAKGNLRAVPAPKAVATLLYGHLAAVFDPPRQIDFFRSGSHGQ